jgi:hypothetical protein
MKTKVFIVMYNRLQWPKLMAEFLYDTNCEPILIDNNSSYIPLLEWYKTCPYKVHLLKNNYGERVFWDSGLFNEYKDEYYVVSDHDLDLSNLPNDYIDKMRYGLDGNKSITKCGLSLKLDDLPDTKYSNLAKSFESKYWELKDDNGFWIAGVDTTFALYDRKRQENGWDCGDKFYYGIRTPEPYSARHLAWYFQENSIEDEEEKWYQSHSDKFWTTIYRREYNININGNS